jgi:chloramphenicol 3-O phosphotransferase
VIKKEIFIKKLNKYVFMSKNGYGRIVFLNGTSSSGKTTIAKELEGILQDRYSYTSVDGFAEVFCREHRSELDGKTLEEANDYIVPRFHDDLARRVLDGESIVVDHILQEPHWTEDFAEKLADYEVILVGVRCPLDVLKLRELEREDYRPTGFAEYHFNRVHVNRQYDLEVNTAHMTPIRCAEAIVSYLEKPNPSNDITTRQKILGKGN